MAGRQGGKVLRGPQSGGLMIGKRAPLKAAQANASPNGGIGRPMKVGKEEQMGMLAAVNSSPPLPESSAAGQPFRVTAEGAAPVVQVEQWVSRDHVAEWAAWEANLQTIADGASALPSVEVRTSTNPALWYQDH